MAPETLGYIGLLMIAVGLFGVAVTLARLVPMTGGGGPNGPDCPG